MAAGVLFASSYWLFQIESYHIQFVSWLIIAYSSLYAVGLYIGFSYVLKRVTPIVMSSYLTCQPVLSSLLSYFVFGTVPTSSQIAGMVS